MPVWFGLTLSLVSAVIVNWAYVREHDAAGSLEPLSLRQPLAAVRVLVGSRRWLVGFAAETGGWLLYVVALWLAPLALVQTVGAAGIGVLALIQSRGDPRRLRPRERWAAAITLAGLVLLGVSLVGTHPGDHEPHAVAAAVWLGACVGAAALVSLVRTDLTRTVALGLSAGLLFATGDIAAKLVGYGGWWLVAVVLLIAGYALGSVELQAAFQHGDALTAAGMATLTTNAVPIVAGVILFRQTLPGGYQRGLQIAAFATLVAGATLLNDPRARTAGPAERGRR
jgi:hypothetical protein